MSHIESNAVKTLIKLVVIRRLYFYKVLSPTALS